MEFNDDKSLEYKLNDQARTDLNRALADAARNLKSTNPEGYKQFVKTTAEAFHLSESTIRRTFTNNRDFIGKRNPRSSASGDADKDYKMRVAFAKAFVLGQDGVQITRDSKSQKINEYSPKVAGSKLREYLSDDYMRTQGLRMRIDERGLVTWEYAKYPDYPEDEEGSQEVEDWSSTLDKWNPGIDANNGYPWEDVM